jgi:hypothetical protein
MLSLSLVILLAGAPMTPKEAEQFARATWFEFELGDVKDWVAFVKAKQAKELALTVAGRTEHHRGEGKLSDAELRARRALQQEFDEVAKKREPELRALARTILEAMAKGDFEPAIADCAMYSITASNRLELTRKYFEEHKAPLQAAAKTAKPEDFAGELDFESPSPETGMTGMVRLSFGPKGAPPKDKELFPERAQVELWWSGEVMPNANGPRNPSPVSPKPASRWRLHQVILPYTLRPTYLQ